MITATGHLRYDPKAPSVAWKPWWCILACGSGWFWRLAPELRNTLEGDWKYVVDRDRVFEGRLVDRTPHLALVKPQMSPPAWGPHISVFRGERPRLNKDAWKGGRGPFHNGDTFEFLVDVERPQTNGHHWFFPVKCSLLGDLREFYGLPRKPRVPFHLTFAIQTPA